MVLYVLLNTFIALVIAALIILLLHRSFKAMLEGLVREKAIQPVLNFIYWTICIGSVVAGSGFIDRSYRGSYSVHLPENGISWFFSIYNSILASSTAIGSIIAIIVFILLVKQVGIMRSQIIAGCKNSELDCL